MTVLKITLLLLGAAFALFGYFIFFKKKYFLINGFEAALKAGRKNEKYARRVGVVEFALGLALLAAGLLLVIFA